MIRQKSHDHPRRRPGISRRGWLAGMGGVVAGGALLGPRYLIRPVQAESDRPPKRLLVILKPCGTVPANYDCAGGERDFGLSPILEPFADLRSHMVVVEGLDIRKRDYSPGMNHGNGMVTFMTGGVTIKAKGFRAVIADRPSIDQILARDPAVAGAAPIQSLQLAADIRSHRDEIFTRVLSYADRAAPLPPAGDPSAVFTRVFGGLVGAGGSQQELERARARKQSILDVSRSSVRRLADRAGAEERARFDSHLAAIRETERLLDTSLACTGARELARPGLPGDVDRLDDMHGEIGLAHLHIIRTAFQCDLTRIATFMWAPGNSPVNFSRTIPGVENRGHHDITHSGGNREHDESAIHRWYNVQMAGFIAAMRDTPDLDGGSLLDSTLIVIFSEIHLGSHTFDNIPIQLFGHAGGLEGGRLLRYGNRSTNDLWTAVASAMGHPIEFFGDRERCDGALPGLFA